MAKKKKDERPEDTEESKSSEEEKDSEESEDTDASADEPEVDEADDSASDDEDDEADDNDAEADDNDAEADDNDAEADDEADDEDAEADDDEEDADDDKGDEDADDGKGTEADDEDADDEADTKASKKKDKKSGKKDKKSGKKDKKSEEKKAEKAKKSDAEKGKKAGSKSKKKKPVAAKPVAGAPADPNAPLSDNIRELFGLEPDEGQREEEAVDYEPDGRTGASVGAVLGLLIVVAAIVGLVVGATQVLKQRQSDIDAAAEKRKAEQEAALEPQVRYGHIAMLASEPPRAQVFQDGKPIYVKTSSGAYTELRVSPDTRIQNVKIEEGAIVRYSIEANGYEPYSLELNEYSWTPMAGGTDWEKIYNKIRLEPKRDRLLSNCEEVAGLGEPWLGACSVSITDEIATRKDYERVYIDPETEVPVMLDGELTIDSEPAGAKIFFNSRPLMKPDGTQAVTPYTFTEYPGPAPKPATPDGEDGTDGTDTPAPDAPAPDGGAPAGDVMNKVSVTGSTSDGRLSVRLEKDGYDPYVTEIRPHFWTCAPQTDLEKIKEITKTLPKKSEETAPHMLHALCDYSLTVKGKLHEPKPEPKPGEEGDGAPSEDGAPAE